MLFETHSEMSRSDSCNIFRLKRFGKTQRHERVVELTKDGNWRNNPTFSSRVIGM